MIDFLRDNIEKDNHIGYIKKSNFNNINDQSDLKTLISFNQHRVDYPEWGENIENFLVDSNIYGKIKTDNLSIDEYKYIFESNISII